MIRILGKTMYDHLIVCDHSVRLASLWGAGNLSKLAALILI